MIIHCSQTNHFDLAEFFSTYIQQNTLEIKPKIKLSEFQPQRLTHHCLWLQDLCLNFPLPVWDSSLYREKGHIFKLRHWMFFEFWRRFRHLKWVCTYTLVYKSWMPFLLYISQLRKKLGKADNPLKQHSLYDSSFINMH